jgi:hypothetical protein
MRGRVRLGADELGRVRVGFHDVGRHGLSLSFLGWSVLVLCVRRNDTGQRESGCLVKGLLDFGSTPFKRLMLIVWKKQECSGW